MTERQFNRGVHRVFRLLLAAIFLGAAYVAWMAPFMAPTERAREFSAAVNAAAWLALGLWFAVREARAIGREIDEDMRVIPRP